MTKLVQGFTDIMQPMNLVVNGNFRINQRGIFGSTPKVVKRGDYVCDGWKLDDSSVHFGAKYCEVSLIHNNSAGIWTLRLHGYGKRGDNLFIFQKHDNSLYPIRNEVKGKAALTGSFSAKCGPSSVPVKLYLNISDGGQSLLDNMPVINSLSGVQTAVTVETYDSDVWYSPYMGCILQADGEFDVYFYQFQVIQGAFKHPPFVQTPYDIDLLRCKRYYQIGNIRLEALGSEDNVNYNLGYKHTFEVEMAGTPTVTIDRAVIYEELTAAIDQSDSYTVTSNYPNSKNVLFSVSKPNTGNKPRMFLIDYTAEV